MSDEINDKSVTGAVTDNKAEKAMPTKEKKSKQAGTSALKAAGFAACKRHGLPRVWVTADGQCFDQESNARSHGKNIGNNECLKVEA